VLAALVDPVDDQIRAAQLFKADDSLIRAHTTQPCYRATPASPATVTGLGLAMSLNATACHHKRALPSPALPRHPESHGWDAREIRSRSG
jgi:hypothetical protein